MACHVAWQSNVAFAVFLNIAVLLDASMKHHVEKQLDMLEGNVSITHTSRIW